MIHLPEDQDLIHEKQEISSFYIPCNTEEETKEHVRVTVLETFDKWGYRTSISLVSVDLDGHDPAIFNDLETDVFAGLPKNIMGKLNHKKNGNISNHSK